VQNFKIIKVQVSLSTTFQKRLQCELNTIRYQRNHLYGGFDEYWGQKLKAKAAQYQTQETPARSICTTGSETQPVVLPAELHVIIRVEMW